MNILTIFLTILSSCTILYFVLTWLHVIQINSEFFLINSYKIKPWLKVATFLSVLYLISFGLSFIIN